MQSESDERYWFLDPTSWQQVRVVSSRRKRIAELAIDVIAGDSGSSTEGGYDAAFDGVERGAARNVDPIP